jgi:type IV secretory pathway VirB9-like protein
MIRRSLPVAAVASLLVLVAAGFGFASGEARTVRYGPRDVVTLSCKVRNTTLVLLPPGEKLLDLVVGDKDMWLLEGNDRYAYIKPAQVGSSTTINLIAQSGNVYTFLAHEVGKSDLQPDVKVFLELADPSQFQPVVVPRFVAAEEADALKAQLAEQAAQAVRDREAFAAAYPTQLAFDYSFQKNKKPFYVAAIWHDDKATYIRARAKDKPTLYQLVDGQPTLIEYQLRGDVYVVPKVLDAGQLKIGTKSLTFLRREN